jgi:hypothetical protein
MGRPRTFAHADPASRMRRSRAALATRGGSLVQVKLDLPARRAVAALQLTLSGVSRSVIAGRALAELSHRQGYPSTLSRDEEIRLARLALGPYTTAAFREEAWADAFLGGLAVALATDHRLPREQLLALARELAPETMTVDGYRLWLDASPIRLARLFKLVDTELAMALSRSAA